MKLSNQQVTALAEKIYKELSDSSREYNSEVQKKRNEWIKKKLSLKENKSLREFYEYLNGSYYKSSLIDYLQTKYKEEYNKLPIECPRQFSQYDVKNDIIIETINCENMEKLISKIKDKYLK